MSLFLILQKHDVYSFTGIVTILRFVLKINHLIQLRLWRIIYQVDGEIATADELKSKIKTLTRENKKLLEELKPIRNKKSPLY